MFIANSVGWYLGAMIWGLLIITPILSKAPRLYGTVIAPIVVLMIYSSICSTYQTILGGFVWIGLMRGIAGMSLGILSWHVSCKIREMNFTRFGSIFLGTIEWFGYLFVILGSYYLKTPSVFDFYWIFFLFLSVSISFSNHGWGVRFLSCPFTSKLGKLSLNLFLNHVYVATFIGVVTNSSNYSNHKLWLFYVIGTILATSLNYFLAQRLRYSIPQIQALFLK